jgi:hypothetical protein
MNQDPLLLADRLLDLVEALGDLVELVLDRGQSGGHAVSGVVDRVCWCWWGVSEQDRISRTMDSAMFERSASSR